MIHLLSLKHKELEEFTPVILRHKGQVKALPHSYDWQIVFTFSTNFSSLLISSIIAARANNVKFQVHDLMDDIAEQQELANEISSAISSPMGFGMEVDEDELLAELEGMEQEDMDRQVKKLAKLFDISLSLRNGLKMIKFSYL